MINVNATDVREKFQVKMFKLCKKCKNEFQWFRARSVIDENIILLDNMTFVAVAKMVVCVVIIIAGVDYIRRH